MQGFTEGKSELYGFLFPGLSWTSFCRLNVTVQLLNNWLKNRGNRITRSTPFSHSTNAVSEGFTYVRLQFALKFVAHSDLRYDFTALPYPGLNSLSNQLGRANSAWTWWLSRPAYIAFYNSANTKFEPAILHRYWDSAVVKTSSSIKNIHKNQVKDIKS